MLRPAPAELPVTESLPPMLEASEITVSLPGTSNELTFPELRVKRGSSLVITGPNASGKTTLLDVLCGFRKVATGKVLVSGKAISAEARFRKKGFGRLFQEPRLVDPYTVRDHLCMTGINASNIEGSVYEQLPCYAERLVNPNPSDSISKHLNPVDPKARVSELSFGQKRLVNLVLCLQRGQSFCILDEPFAGLETGLERPVANALKEHSEVRDASLVIAGHRTSVLYKVFDKIDEYELTM